jgi:hypothetical protein
MKRYATQSAAALGVLVMGICFARGSLAAVSVVPAQSSVTVGQASTITIRYQFTGLLDPGNLPYTGIADSITGVFLGPGRANLGSVPTAVIGNVVNGSGAVTEVLTVPASVIDTAVRLGITQIIYERTFAGPANAPTSQAIIAIATSEAVGPLRIIRIELYFENRRGETTVSRNHRGLKAYADIRYGGTGVLRGFWEVDGRRILDVNRQLTFGTNVTLSTPDVPDLSTFDTGTHIVRFIPTNPLPAGPLPELLYYVTAARDLRSIRIAVQEGTAGGGTPATHSFSWEKPPGMELFFIEFSEEAGGKPVFSAFTREAGYKLPGKGVEGIFTPGKRYFWRVKGYDGSDYQVGESAAAPFQY